jgi:hypothetical protein
VTSFVEVLRPLSARLPLPQPARTRVLLEIAADLEDMYRHYRASGLTEEEARLKAVNTFDLSEEALAELVRVHTSLFRRLLDRLSAQAQSRWERGLLLIVAGTLAFVCVQVVLRGELVAVAGTQVWPTLICGLTGLTLGLVKFYSIHIKQDHELRRARRGLDAIAILAGAQVFLGFLAGWFSLYLTARRMTGDVEYAGAHLFNWLLSASALLSVSLMGALLTAMIWFALARRVAGIAEAEAALLT